MSPAGSGSGAPASGGVALDDPPRPLWHHPAFGWTLCAGAALAALLYAGWNEVSGALFELELSVAALLPQHAIAGSAWFLLPLVGFAGGALASLSPCILPLVPLNAAYIGATGATGARAVGLSARFVLGAAAALTLLGIAGDFAGWLLIDQRGPVLIGAGLLMAYLGLASIEAVSLPGVGRAPGGSRRLGPMGAGAAFALITTPCASPLLAAVLAAASAQSVPGLTAASMAGFALGYTLLVFVAGAFGGELVRRLRGRAFAAPRAAAAALLIVAGAGFAAAGVAWF